MQKGRATPKPFGLRTQDRRLSAKSGIVHFFALGIVLLVVLAAVGVWAVAKRTRIEPKSETATILEVESNASPEPTIKPDPKGTPSPSSKPKVSTNVTSKPTPAPAVEFKDPCANYKDTQLVYVKVKLVPPTGALDENAKIVVKPGSDCPAGLPTGYTSQVERTVKPGDSLTWTSPGFTMGDIRVNVDYKGNGYGYDVEGTGGTHEVIINLKN